MKSNFIDNSDKVLKEFDEKITDVLELIGLKAEGYAKEDCPVDTGLLRNSISHATQDKTAYIGTDVVYAPKIEYGDKLEHTTGKAHFLRDAATNHSDEYRETVEKVLKGNHV